MTRYIFITGGVVSSLGKGLGSAALGALLQAQARRRYPPLQVYPVLDQARVQIHRQLDLVLKPHRIAGGLVPPLALSARNAPLVFVQHLFVVLCRGGFETMFPDSWNIAHLAPRQE